MKYFEKSIKMIKATKGIQTMIKGDKKQQRGDTSFASFVLRYTKEPNLAVKEFNMVVNCSWRTLPSSLKALSKIKKNIK